MFVVLSTISKSKPGVWTTLLINMNGLLFISTPVFTLLYNEVTIPLLSDSVNCVPAIPVNSKDMSSKITFLSFSSKGSNFLENNLPENEEAVCNP